jgi:valyl-tRNA synthetase
MKKILAALLAVVMIISFCACTKEKETAQSELNRAQGMLSNEKFVSKAPEKLITGEKEKVAKYTEMIEKIDERLKELNNQ